MFSKPIRENVFNREPCISNKDIPKLSYNDFYKNNISLKKYKLPELKTIVRQYKLRITGNKDELIARIVTHFDKMKKAKIILRLI